MVAFATAAELGTFTGRTIAPARAELLLELASGAVREHCEWHIAPSVTETITLDAVPERILLLPTAHVTDVASVAVDGVSLDPATYRWSTLGRMWRCRGWGWDYRSIDVELTHGYAVAPIVVKSVVLTMAARPVVNPESLKALTVGGISRTFANGSAADAGIGVSTLEADLLAGYVVRGRA